MTDPLCPLPQATHGGRESRLLSLQELLQGDISLLGEVEQGPHPTMGLGRAAPLLDTLPGGEARSVVGGTHGAEGGAPGAGIPRAEWLCPCWGSGPLLKPRLVELVRGTWSHDTEHTSDRLCLQWAPCCLLLT